MKKSLMLCVFLLCCTRPALSHCDALDGPVVRDARAALEKADVLPVLKWVRQQDEQEIRDCFNKALAVRDKGPAAEELADRYFSETAVRLHRAGEGEPFTGLKSAGEHISPAVTVAEKALAAGTPEALKNFLTLAVAQGLQEKFKTAADKQKFNPADTRAGREYVRAYVSLMHYAEAVYQATLAENAAAQNTSLQGRGHANGQARLKTH